jgi:hypothetical protein
VGINIELQDEFGGTLESLPDSQNILGELLPTNEDAYPMLTSIDPYGDTVFNRIQMQRFLREWRVFAANAGSADELSFFAAVESLAVRCSEDVHLYLKFIGD